MTISLNERDRRFQGIRTMMEEEKLSILLVASNAMWTGHVRYFSNYPTFFGYAYVVFPKDENPTQFVFSKIQAQIASRQWIKDVRQTLGYPEVVIERIRELDHKNKRIGLVGVENISFKMYGLLRSELPSATFVDAAEEIFKLRMIKSGQARDE